MRTYTYSTHRIMRSHWGCSSALMLLWVSSVSVSVCSASEWLQLSTTGVAADEGAAVGSPVTSFCDLDCCKQQCDLTLECNSFAHMKGACYLKDKCIVAESTAVIRSAYRTYYRTGRCPRSVATVMADAAAATKAVNAAKKAQAQRKPKPGPDQAIARRRQPDGGPAYSYPPTAKWPIEAGEPLPKLFMDMGAPAPFGALPKEVRLVFLVKSRPTPLSASKSSMLPFVYRWLVRAFSCW